MGYIRDLLAGGSTALYETIRLTTRRLLGRAYERFWKLPVWVVVVVLWIGGR